MAHVILLPASNPTCLRNAMLHCTLAGYPHNTLWLINLRIAIHIGVSRQSFMQWYSFRIFYFVFWNGYPYQVWRRFYRFFVVFAIVCIINILFLFFRYVGVFYYWIIQILKVSVFKFIFKILRLKRLEFCATFSIFPFALIIVELTYSFGNASGNSAIRWCTSFYLQPLRWPRLSWPLASSHGAGNKPHMRSHSL